MGDPNHTFNDTLTGTPHVGGEHYSLVQIATDPSNPRYIYVGARYGNASRTAPFGLFGQVPLRAVVAVSSDGGATFSSPMDIMSAVPSTQVYGDFIPTLAVGNTGTVYAFTRELDPPLLPGGAAATASSPPGVSGDGPRQMVSISTDHARTWKMTFMDTSGIHCSACLQNDEPDGTVAHNGNIYAVWAQAAAKGSPNSIVFTSSTNGGRTFTTHVTLSDKSSPMDAEAPGIAVAPNGRIDVAWIDFRSSLTYSPATAAADELYWDVYYTFSTDGGKTWSKDIRISDRSMNKNGGYTESHSYGLEAHEAVSATNDVTYFAWSDSRNGTTTDPVEDYYFTTAVHSTPPVPRTFGSGIGFGVAIGLLGAGVAIALIATRRRGPRAKAAATGA
ncbi:MAG: sialidase family protein [Acidimicrobiales bacterium]